MYSVYKITNTVNNKNYIGITSRSVEERFKDHLSRAKNQGRFSRLYSAMRKYGSDKFTVSLITTTESSEMVRSLETVYISALGSYKNGYNCNMGGHGALDISEETRKKIGNANRGRVISEEGRKRMSEAKIGESCCVKNFGDYIKKGSNNPLSKCYRIEFPDGGVKTIRGMRQFIKQHNLSTRIYSGKSKGFILLERFNDYPKREYTQASGSAHLPTG